MSLDELLQQRIRTIADWPTEGVQFRDIMPLLADPEGLSSCVAAMRSRLDDAGFDDVHAIAGIEARGFILGSALAMGMGVGFVAIRKAGKLPGDVVSQSYDLEYGTATLEIQRDLLRPGARVVLVDDVLATGGTAAAAAQLLDAVGAQVVGLISLLELGALGGRERLTGLSIESLHQI